MSKQSRTTRAREGYDWKQLALRLAPVVVAVLTFVAFLPALHAEFVTWDDDRNFLANQLFRGLGMPQLAWMWTTFHMGHYVPLTWMTLGLDYVVWGMNPVGYHLTNLALHAANAALVYTLAQRLLRYAAPSLGSSPPAFAAAAFAALFFSVHPLRVESVAWVTERRDMLSLLFYLATVLLYLRAYDRPDQRRWYVGAVVTFTAALLSKATAMSLPAVLLILNVYPLRRIGGSAAWWSESARRAFLSVIPFAALASAAIVLSMVALRPPAQLDTASKVAVSAYSLGFYIQKTLLPLGLSPLYEMPRSVNASAPSFLVAYCVVVVFAAGAWAARRRFPGVTTALLAFVVIILPMLGIVQNGPQIAADRYTYHAAAALALVAGVLFFPLTRPITVARGAVAAVVLVGLATLTWRQAGVWKNSEALWSRVVRLDPESPIGNVALAVELARQNRLDEAIEAYEHGLRADPSYAEGHNNLGVALVRRGRLAEAIAHYERAIAYKHDYDAAHENLGVAIAQQGNPRLAIEHYEQALSINPSNADAEVNWGNALVRMGNPSEAIEHYAAAVRMRPDHADAHHNWGVALARQGKLGEAIEQFRRALAINPNHAEAKEYLDRAVQLTNR